MSEEAKYTHAALQWRAETLGVKLIIEAGACAPVSDYVLYDATGMYLIARVRTT